MADSEPLSGPHYRFAVGVAIGLSAAEAYRDAYPKSKASSAERNSTRLTKMEPIQREISRIRSRADQLGGAAVLSILEKREFIAKLVRSKLASTPDDSDLWQEISITENGTKRKLGDKLRAIALDNDLAGDGSEAGANQAIGSMAEAMSRIRSKRWMK